jgi:ribosomal protein L37E
MKSNTYYDNLFRKVLTETLEGKADEIMEKLKFNPPGSSFDYVQEGETCERCGSEMNEGDCMECGYSKGEVMEKLHGKQRNLDKNKNNRLDSEDFKILRGKKERKEGKYSMEEDEMEEGNAFSGALADAKKDGKSSFSVDGKKYPVKESKKQNVDNTLYKLEYINETALFTEDEIIDIIEGIIKDRKSVV